MIEQVGNLIFVNGVFERDAGIAEDGKPVPRTIRLDRIDTPYGQALVLVQDKYYRGDTPTVVRGFDAGIAGQYFWRRYAEPVIVIKTIPGEMEQRIGVAKILKERGYQEPIGVERISY